MEYIFGLELLEYSVSFNKEKSIAESLLSILSLPLAHLFSGLGEKMFFHGHEDGSEQKKADLPHFQCIWHPWNGALSVCLGPLFFY